MHLIHNDLKNSAIVHCIPTLKRAGAPIARPPRVLFFTKAERAGLIGRLAKLPVR